MIRLQPVNKKFRIQTGLSLLVFCSFLFAGSTGLGQSNAKKPKIQYGVASYYSDKFVGRKTSNGEIFSQKKLTGAHNTLPLGTYVRVTNLRNKRSVVVKINDRLHNRNKRLIDLTKLAAQKLGYVKAGLTRVKVEVLSK
jgi:rare lipoprotein A